jgi:dehydrogenase/reductase SDR family member 1
MLRRHPSAKMRAMGALTGQVCLVTGASRGIGKGCALELGAAGATVYVTGRSVAESDHPLPGTVSGTAAAVDAEGGTGIAVACDHRDDTAVEELFARIAAEHGRIDVVVNSAFIVPPELTSGRPFWDVPLSNWDDMVGVGTRSAYVTSALAARMMVPEGRGVIVNISSSGATEYAWSVAYGVGKCALDRLTADTAHELRPHGVSVVSLWPGFVRTERIDIALTAGMLPASLDVSSAESPRFTGRAAAALATDPDAARWSGRAVASRDIADHYGFTDVDGRLPAGPLHDRTA